MRTGISKTKFNVDIRNFFKTNENSLTINGQIAGGGCGEEGMPLGPTVDALAQILCEVMTLLRLHDYCSLALIFCFEKTCSWIFKF